MLHVHLVNCMCSEVYRYIWVEIIQYNMTTVYHYRDYYNRVYYVLSCATAVERNDMLLTDNVDDNVNVIFRHR